MKSPLQFLRRRTGLWVLRELVQTLKEIRTELVLIRCLQEELARRPPNGGTTVQIGAQSFVTSKPDATIRIEAGTGGGEGEAGGVEYTSDEMLAKYEAISFGLWKVLGRQPSTEEIEHEYLLRFEP
jgi:hypothetical protein